MMAKPSSGLVLYDNLCLMCSTIAALVRSWSRSKILVLGHYSKEGMDLKAKLFKEYQGRAEEMFWLVRGHTCYGGRSAILPLLTEIVRSIVR